VSRARLEPGELGRVSFERRGNSLRGLARARDGAGNIQPLRATGATEDEIRADLARQAAALVYAADEWSPRTTLGDTVERWLSTQGRSPGGNRAPKQQPQSVEVYTRAARGLVIPRLGMLRLEQITAGRLNEFLDRLQDEPRPGTRRGEPKIGYSDSYRKQALHVLKQSLNRAVVYGALAYNPALSLEPITVEVGESRALTPEQVAALRRCVRQWESTHRSGPRRGPRLRLAIELALATGARIGEVVGFQLSGVSEVPQLALALTGTAATVDNKLVRSERLKHDERHRILLLPGWASAAIDECRTLAVCEDFDAPLLQGRTGAMLSPGNLRRDLGSMTGEQFDELAQAGIDLESFTFHSLRHTALNQIEKRTGDIEHAKAQAGHASSKTTSGYVARPSELPVIAGAVSAIEAAFGRGA
tara:strand:- start:1292 stop:2545 length:1254 start_codon:yes stop_codon:yes gene_type:complete